MHYRRLFTVAAGGAAVAGALVCCQAPAGRGAAADTRPAAAPAAPPKHPDAQVIMDFEAPAPVRWVPAGPAATAPAETEPATGDAAVGVPPPPAVFTRSSLRPQEGLWSEQVTLRPENPATAAGGRLAYVQETGAPLDLGRCDLVTAAVTHLGRPARNGEWVASLELTDAAGMRVEGDAFAVTSRWEEVSVDLHAAFDAGLDVSRITSVAVAFRPVRTSAALPASREATTEPEAPDASPLDVQTDSWVARKSGRVYTGDRQGPKGTFYVVSQGGRLRVGSVDGYELTFQDRGMPPGGGAPRPWLEAWAGGGDVPRRQVLGQPGTGLSLYDVDRMDAVAGPGATGRQKEADDGALPSPGVAPATGWPLPAPRAGAGGGGNTGENEPAESRWRWEVVWTSPVGAIVEVKQEAGPYDRLGEPAGAVTWRFMIYQWGQVFVHARWGRSEMPLAPPVSWVLAVDNGAVDRATGARQDANAERLLAEVYPVAVRDGLQTALPHRMQTGNPVALIGRTATANGSLAKDAWWWATARLAGQGGGGAADGGDRRLKLMGVGLGSAQAAANAADCMLLVNTPNALMKAAAFGQYLVPPKVLCRQGEVDRNFPGDADNDGFVESYGFQVVRLASGRATFTIYPQGRPIFYPTYLFTVPAVERESLDLAHSRVLINIDGKQFADPPQFPDGSFLLQVPFVLDKPVTVEAILVKR